MPKPVHMLLSTYYLQLSFIYEREAREAYDFYLKDIIIEYEKDDYNRKVYYYGGGKYAYKYFVDYVSVDIPTERYNWFLLQAGRLAKRYIYRNSMNQSNGYTWIIAESDTNVKCCIYSKELDQLVPAGKSLIKQFVL